MGSVFDKLELTVLSNEFYQCIDLLEGDNKARFDKNRELGIMSRIDKKTNKFQIRIDEEKGDVSNVARFLKDKFKDESMTPEALKDYLDQLKAEKKLMGGSPPLELPAEPVLPKSNNLISNQAHGNTENKPQRNNVRQNNAPKSNSNSDLKDIKKAEPQKSNLNSKESKLLKSKSTNPIDDQKSIISRGQTENEAFINFENPEEFLKNLNYTLLENQCVISGSPELINNFNIIKNDIIKDKELNTTSRNNEITIRHRNGSKSFPEQVIKALTLLCKFKEGSINPVMLQKYAKTESITPPPPKIQAKQEQPMSTPPKIKSESKPKNEDKKTNSKENNQQTKVKTDNADNKVVNIPVVDKEIPKPVCMPTERVTSDSAIRIGPDLKKEILKYILFLPPNTDFTSIDFEC